MVTLTIETATAQYLENLDWDGDAAKARLALSALRALRVLKPAQLSGAGSGMSYADIVSEIEKLEAFVDATSMTRRTAFTSARSRWT